MHHRHFTIIPFTMFPAVQRCKQFIHNIIHIYQVHHYIRIVHLNGQIMGYIMAECSHRTVIVGATPLTKYIRKTIDQHFCASFFTIIKHQLFSCPLRLTVRIILSSLRGRREHHRARIAVFFQCIKQCGGKAKIPLHEFRRFFRTVHACKVEHKIRLTTINVQLRGVTVHVILKHSQLLPFHSIIAGFPRLNVMQLGYEVSTDKPFGAGY